MRRRPAGIANELRLRVVDLDERALRTDARRRARLEDLAEDETFHEALGLLVRSYETEAHLNLIGRVRARQETIRLLVNRLGLVEDRKHRPEIATQEIRRPLVLTGLPRSGTTFLHALLAQDPRQPGAAALGNGPALAAPRASLVCRRSTHRRSRAAAALVPAAPAEDQSDRSARR